jgi:hypothetical protein
MENTTASRMQHLTVSKQAEFDPCIGLSICILKVFFIMNPSTEELAKNTMDE